MMTKEREASGEAQFPDPSINSQPIALDERGGMILSNHSQMARVTSQWMRSNMLPGPFMANSHWQQDTRYVVTPDMARQRIFTAVQMLYGMGFAFNQSINWLRCIAFVKGAVFIYGDLPITLVERSGLLEDKEEFLFDEDGAPISRENKNLRAAVFGAACRVKPKGRTWKETTFTVEDAIQAGLLPLNGVKGKFPSTKQQERFVESAWCKHYKRMMQFRARGFALRDNFAAAFAECGKPSILEADAPYVPAEYGSADETDKAFARPQESTPSISEMY